MKKKFCLLCSLLMLVSTLNGSFASVISSDIYEVNGQKVRVDVIENNGSLGESITFLDEKTVSRNAFMSSEKQEIDGKDKLNIISEVESIISSNTDFDKNQYNSYEMASRASDWGKAYRFNMSDTSSKNSNVIVSSLGYINGINDNYFKLNVYDSYVKGIYSGGGNADQIVNSH